MQTIIISLWLSVSFSGIWFYYLNNLINKPQSFEDFFKNTVLKDPGFIQAQKNILAYSKTTASSNIPLPDYKKGGKENKLFPLDFTPPKRNEKGEIIWATSSNFNEEEEKKYKNIWESHGIDLKAYEKVNDMQFIDLNKQAQNEAVQSQHFAEIVYLLEEFMSMLRLYPDQIHEVSQAQRKAIFDKFIFLKK